MADTEYGCATTSLENGLSYLNKLHELGVRTVVFSTREPLLYDGLCRLIYEAKLLDMPVALEHTILRVLFGNTDNLVCLRFDFLIDPAICVRPSICL